LGRRNEHRILVRKLLSKLSLERPRMRSEANINLELRDVVCGDEVNETSWGIVSSGGLWY
jgi:hypothetical protein